MRFRLTAYAVLILIALVLLPGSDRAEPAAASDRVPATCTRVVDGDTIICDIAGVETRVRLIGVDTPETVHPQKDVQPFGPEASAYTKAALTGQTVYLEYDVQRTDRYGRDLCYVWLEDGTLFNDQLVRDGYASVATFPPNVKYVDRFRASAADAMARGAGLYADASDVIP